MSGCKILSSIFAAFAVTSTVWGFEPDKPLNRQNHVQARQQKAKKSGENVGKNRRLAEVRHEAERIRKELRKVSHAQQERDDSRAHPKTTESLGEMFKVNCEGTYQHHLQGVCTDEKSIFWSFTTTLVKTDMIGTLLNKIPVANHHGDLCYHDGKLYVAVNLGKFNDPRGNADSWVYVYDAESLEELERYETAEVFHGAGGIGYRNRRFFVVGGLPDAVDENYVYEYDENFNYLNKHVIKSGHTHLGIQTATFAHDRWWLGCYGDPQILLVTDAHFRMQGRHEIDCSLGIAGLTHGRLLVGSGRCDTVDGCQGTVQTAVPDERSGFQIRSINGKTE